MLFLRQINKLSNLLTDHHVSREINEVDKRYIKSQEGEDVAKADQHETQIFQK